MEKSILTPFQKKVLDVFSDFSESGIEKLKARQNKINCILKKGGLIFVKCKSTDDALFGKGERVGENMYKKGHVRHFFTKEYMTEKLKRFKIIKVRKTSSVYHEYKSAFIEAVATK